jgi:hypothetical protein
MISAVIRAVAVSIRARVDQMTLGVMPPWISPASKLFWLAAVPSLAHRSLG